MRRIRIIIRLASGSKRLCLAAASTVGIAAVGAVLVLTVTDSSSAAVARPAAAPVCSDGTLVQTREGPVCGVVADGVTSYLGVPYAAPPVGSRRFASPGPVAPWTAPLQATQVGADCPQPVLAGSVPRTTSEDCLTLNVYVPAGAQPGRLPVMVEVHGGGFVIGGPPSGARLAADGHVIMVAIHYRLGILGFLAHAALGAHSGDYGLQDQQTALRWVKRNIARFGGDPGNVTLFGQSAGGASVCAAAASPTAAGLFQKGISESAYFNYNVNTIWSTGDCKSQLQTESEAQDAGATFADKVGCGGGGDVAACLRAVPVQTLIDNGGKVLDPTGGGTIGPIVNGTTLPESPATAIAKGHLNDIRLMIGVARDEFNGGLYDPSVTANTPAEYRALVRQQYGSLTPVIMRLYPLSRFPDRSPFIAYRTVMADAVNVCPEQVANRQLADDVPLYVFENDNADTPRLDASLPLGAFHNAENPYLFPNPNLVMDANQRVFGDQIVAQWAGFARTGRATVPGAPRWPRYTTAHERVMSLVPAGDSAITPARIIERQHNCGFWDAVNESAPWQPRSARR